MPQGKADGKDGLAAWWGRVACLAAMVRDPQKENPAAKAKKGRRSPRRITPGYLENAGLFYLERYATSAANFRRVLMRKVHRSALFHGTDVEEGAQWVEDLIVRYQRSGLLDDRRYADTKVTQLHRRGAAIRQIQGKLREKGVAADVIEGALESLREGAERPDLAAAVAYVRRRRLGPFRAPDARVERFQRDLAALGRAGFPYDIARDVLQAESPAALEALLEADG